MSLKRYATIKRDESGDLALPVQLIYGADAIRQRLKTRLRFFRGEWFLDERLGIPYYRDILVKNPNLELVKTIYRETILNTPGVDYLKSLQLTFDPKTRKVSVEFDAVLLDGESLRPQPEEFIIQV